MRTGVALFAQNYTDWERFDSGDWDTDPRISDRQIFKFGSMSVAEAESSIRLFGATVLPAPHDMKTPQPIVPDADPV
jgi:hypothetical protein